MSGKGGKRQPERRMVGRRLPHAALALVAACLLVAAVTAIPYARSPENALQGPVAPSNLTPSDIPENPDTANGPDGFTALDGAVVPASELVEGTAGVNADHVGGSDSPDDGSYQVISDDGVKAEHQAGVIVAQLSEGVSLEDLNEEIAACDWLAPQVLSEDDVSLGWASLKLAEGVAVPDAIGLTGELSAVAGAQPNYVYTLDEEDAGDSGGLQVGSIMGAPDPDLAYQGGESYSTYDYSAFVDDPIADNQMVLLAVRAREAYQYTHDAQHRPTLWEEASARPSIAIIDTGVQASHEDLAANMVKSYDAVNKVERESYIGSHGTHVAGIAAAKTNNGKGIVGVSFDAGIVSVKVFTNKNGSVLADSVDILEGYEYVIEHAEEFNIRVANMSLGSTTETSDRDDKALLEAIDRAYEKGVLTTISAGNDALAEGGAYTDFPSDFSPNSIGVIDCAVTDVEENAYEPGDPAHLFTTRLWLTRDEYSNFNKPGTMNKQLSALGSSVMSTVPAGYGDGDAGSKLYQYGRKNGTSMAAPCVAGVAALVLSIDPNLTVDQLKSILYSSAADVGDQSGRPHVMEGLDPTTAGFDVYTGFGAVDAFDAVVAADTHTYITGPTLMAVGNAGTMRVPESAHASSVVWSSLDPGVISIDAQTGAVHALKSGPAIIRALCVVPALPALTAGESEPVAGGTADETRTVELYTIVTVFDARIKGPDSVQYGQTITLGLDASPASGTWEWSSDTDSVTVGKWGDDGTGNVTVAGKKKGAATITATLTSNRAIKVTKRVTVTAADISKANVTLAQTSYEYDGKAKTPAVTVKLGSTTLKRGTDYDVAYSSNTAVGTQARVTITGKGNYTGTVTRTFTIKGIDISRANVTLLPASYEYDGKAKTPAVTVKLGSTALRNGADYTVEYANNVAAGQGRVTIRGKGNYTGTVIKTFQILQSPTQRMHRVQYRTHVQNVGWQAYVRDGVQAGTSGRSLRLEGINISLVDHPYSGSIRYRTHIQNIGWESGWKYDGAMSGTSGRSLRLEAIQIELTGEMASRYDVYYRVHCQNIGWMGWARNGAQAGTAGYAYRLEAIQVKLVPKGGAAPGPTAGAFQDTTGSMSGIPDAASNVVYRTHVQNVGWQCWMRDGEVSGTSGRSLRLEGINIKLGGRVPGGIRYATHVQNIGWQDWSSNGAMSGTSGRSLRLEAIKIELTGEAARKYDVYYRVHCQNIGWMGWARNGAQAGTAGYAYRLEAIQVKLVPKGGAAPGPTAGAFRQS